MAQHAQLRIETGLEVYFCDPQSPWQRGTNENTNGLLRQYFPRGTDLARHGADDLADPSRVVQIGEVADPKLIRALGHEPSLDQVRRTRRCLVDHREPAPPPAGPGAEQPVRAQQPLDATAPPARLAA
jgi:hypothetical protein